MPMLWGSLKYWPTMFLGLAVAVTLLPFVLFLGAMILVVFWPLILVSLVVFVLMVAALRNMMRPPR